MESDLSDYASDDFPEDVKHSRRLSADHEHTPEVEPSARPSKRLRLHNRAPSSPPSHINAHPADDLGELSEDTDGSVPASPHHPGMSADDDYGQDQVTICKWEGCEAGDLDNMDNLVEHLHEDHIGTRQKKYSCEWSDCNRKGIPHASGYALRAHMRSHTREKPFYCTLPECDRSFTRSDALAKHMRTVHETEALRPSDPVPKHHSSNPSNKFQRLKLVLNDAKKAATAAEKGSTPASPSSHSHPLNSASVPPAAAAAGNETDHAHNNVVYMQDYPNAPTMVQFPSDIAFSEQELSLSAPELFRLLRRQLHFATQEGEVLRHDAAALEKKRKEEWVAKELLVENVMEAELSTTRRKRLDEGLLDDPKFLLALERDAAPSRHLNVKDKAGKVPWWKEDTWFRRIEEAQVAAARGVTESGPEGDMPDSRQDDTVPQEPVAEETV